MRKRVADEWEPDPDLINSGYRFTLSKDGKTVSDAYDVDFKIAHNKFEIKLDKKHWKQLVSNTRNSNKTGPNKIQISLDKKNPNKTSIKNSKKTTHIRKSKKIKTRKVSRT